MHDIKTKTVAEKTIKTFDRSVNAAKHLKNVTIHTKEQAEQSTDPKEQSPAEFAANRISASSKTAGRKTVQQADKIGRKSVGATKENFIKTKNSLQERKMKKAAAGEHDTKSYPSDRGNVRPSQGARYKVAKEPAGEKKSSGKGSIKTPQRTIKTSSKAVRSADQVSSGTKSSVKTANRTVKASKQSYSASRAAAKRTAKAADRTAKAASKAAQNTASAAKRTVKATVSSVKSVIAGTKALIAALAAGGWIAVMVIIIICMVALLVTSCFGIFFSHDYSGTEMTLQSAMAEINGDFNAKIETIGKNIKHDKLETDGGSADWEGVLAIYAVKTTTDPKNPDQVVTMDDMKKSTLKSIFWDMNQVSSKTEKRKGKVYLHILVEHTSTAKMADKYHFTADQKKQLEELLSDENQSLWDEIIRDVAQSGSGGTASGGMVSGSISRKGYQWPAPGTTIITSGVGPRWGTRHNGIDISSGDAFGKPIVATKDGTVIVANKSGWGGGYGLHVILDHGEGITSLYGHASKVIVNVGEKVKQGQVIAYIGSTGDSTGPHLHFEIRRDGAFLDPEEFVHP